VSTGDYITLEIQRLPELWKPKFLLKGFPWFADHSIPLLWSNLPRGAVRLWMFGGHAKLWYVSDGSINLKNMDTSSSGEGTTNEGGFFFEMLEITADG